MGGEETLLLHIFVLFDIVLGPLHGVRASSKIGVRDTNFRGLNHLNTVTCQWQAIKKGINPGTM